MFLCVTKLFLMAFIRDEHHCIFRYSSVFLMAVIADGLDSTLDDGAISMVALIRLLQSMHACLCYPLSALKALFHVRTRVDNYDHTNELSTSVHIHE